MVVYGAEQYCFDTCRIWKGKVEQDGCTFLGIV